MKNILVKSGKSIANMALKVTEHNVNSTCLFFLHQPKLPEKAKKLRKF
jgi:cyclic lactone autoinducer peptide